jgi:hypothetical protein
MLDNGIALKDFRQGVSFRYKEVTKEFKKIIRLQ